MKEGGNTVDNATIIRIVAGILFVAGVIFLIQRRRRKVV